MLTMRAPHCLSVLHKLKQEDRKLSHAFCGDFKVSGWLPFVVLYGVTPGASVCVRRIKELNVLLQSTTRG